jgi:hypothetical protein
MGRKVSPLEELVVAGVAYNAYQKGKNPFWAVIKFYGALIFMVLAAMLALVIYNDSNRATPAETTAVAPADAPVAVAPAPVDTPFAEDRLGNVTEDTTVLGAAGAVIGTAHRGRPVHIIGMGSGQVHIRMHNGQEGWLPQSSVADAGPWVGSMPERAGSP